MSREAASYSMLVHRAFDFAARAHEGHYRKNLAEKIPYFSHCAMVARLLERAGFDEEVVAAGVLHDTVEDTGTRIAEIEEHFGARVAAIVGDVTERDKTQSWEVRKEEYIHRLECKASFEALAVSCADKTHNLWSILLYHGAGRDAWSILKRDREAQIERFDTVARIYRQRFDHPLREGFEEVLARVKAQC